jgi:ABC-2 type transport system permease protein
MRRLIAAEFRKLFATRTWLWLLLAAMELTALFVWVTIVGNSSSANKVPPLSSVAGQQTVLSIAAGTAGGMIAVLAALGMTGEFRHQTATVTFLATPRRSLVLLAKLVTYALAGVGYAVICAAEGAAIALPWLSGKGIHVSLTGASIPAVLATVVVTVVIYSLIGTGLGAVLRDQVVAVVALLVYLFAIEPIVMRIPGLASVAIYLPGPAGNALSRTHQAALSYLPPWQGGILLALYAGAAVAAGMWLTVRRDVT